MSALRVVIVGGGISGLSLAWELQKQDVNYTVLEKSGRLGGKVQTDMVDSEGDTPFVVEGGPDSFLTQKPWALQLARELGLDDDLLGTNDEKRNVFVLNRGKPVILPDGVLLIVPTKFMPFVTSPLISPLGKLRMGMEMFIPSKKDDEDETLAQFVRRRLGNEALDKIAEPLMSGIYNAEAEQQSIMATFPRFRALEKEYGNLTRGMLASRRKRADAAPPSSLAAKPKTSAFMSLKGGTTQLIDALVAQLTGDLRTGTGVERIQPHDDGTYTVMLDDGTWIDADMVALTAPSYVAADLVRDFAPDAADDLDGIRYVSTGTISMAFRESDIPKPLNGFGVVIPSSEARPINAVTISSTKFDHRAPEGYVLLRAFFGGSRSPESMNLDEPTLLTTVREQLNDILGISAEPLFHRVYHWWDANPQYDLGHLERVARIESALPPGIVVTGSAYRGVGMPDCVHQSQLTAKAILQHAGSTPAVLV